MPSLILQEEFSELAMSIIKEQIIDAISAKRRDAIAAIFVERMFSTKQCEPDDRARVEDAVRRAFLAAFDGIVAKFPGIFGKVVERSFYQFYEESKKESNGESDGDA